MTPKLMAFALSVLSICSMAIGGITGYRYAENERPKFLYLGIKNETSISITPSYSGGVLTIKEYSINRK